MKVLSTYTMSTLHGIISNNDEKVFFAAVMIVLLYALFKVENLEVGEVVESASSSSSIDVEPEPYVTRVKLISIEDLDTSVPENDKRTVKITDLDECSSSSSEEDSLRTLKVEKAFTPKEEFSSSTSEEEGDTALSSEEPQNFRVPEGILSTELNKISSSQCEELIADSYIKTANNKIKGLEEIIPAIENNNDKIKVYTPIPIKENLIFTKLDLNECSDSEEEIEYKTLYKDYSALRVKYANLYAEHSELKGMHKELESQVETRRAYSSRQIIPSLENVDAEVARMSLEQDYKILKVKYASLYADNAVLTGEFKALEENRDSLYRENIEMKLKKN